MSKYESIWDLLNNFIIQIDTNKHNELTCAICMNIMVNAHQSICGCRYCLKCVLEYLNGAEKCCPGPTKDCKEQIISPVKGIQVDHVANMKVSKIIVKCPETDCNFVDELRTIEDHVKSHKVKCPYFEIGCSQKLNSIIDEHLNGNLLLHSNLMMDTIHNLKNELSTVKEISEKKEIATQFTIEQLKSSNLDDRELINKLQIDISNCNTTNLQLKGELASLKNDIKMMKANNNKKLANLTTEINKLNLKSEKDNVNLDKSDKNSETINNFSEKTDQYTKEIDANSQKIKQNTKNIVANSQKINQNSKKISQNSQKINQYSQKIENCIKSYSVLQADLVALSNETKMMKHKVVEKNVNVSNRESTSGIMTEIIIPETGLEETEKSPENANNIEKLKSRAKSLRKNLNKIKRNQEQVDKDVGNIESACGSEEVQPVKMPSLRVAFTWVVNKFSEKQKHAETNGDWFILSEPFYSGPDGTGYKLCLTVYPNGIESTNNTQLSLGFHVMQGENDDQLEWPLRSDVSIGLVDQEAEIITLAETYSYQSTRDKNKYRFNRPVTGMNKARGSTMFINLTELLENSRLYKNDSIVLQCIVAAAI